MLDLVLDRNERRIDTGHKDTRHKGLIPELIWPLQ